MNLSTRTYIKRVKLELAQRPEYDNPQASREAWRSMVANGRTLLGYYDLVEDHLLSEMPGRGLPEPLAGFKLKRPVGEPARQRAVNSLLENGYSIHSPNSAMIAAVIEEAFLLLEPFIVFGPATTINPCRDLAVVLTNRAMEAAQDLREAEHVPIFTWDGFSPLPNLSELGVRNERHFSAAYG